MMNTHSIVRRHLLALATAAIVVASGSSRADDIEVFVAPNLTGVTPNLVFAIDLSASMNKAPDGTNTVPSRLDIMKQAMVSVMNNPQLPEVNVGFTYFRGNHGSGIKFPAAALDSDASTIDPAIPPGTTVRDVLTGMLQATTAGGITPTVESMYEIARYVRGQRPYFGLNDNFGSWNTTSMQYTGGSGGMPDGYRAANRVSYTGSVNYVPLAHPTGWNSTCEDKTMSTPAGSDGCAAPRAAGTEMSCELIYTPESIISAVSERVCSDTQCDSGCGTVCTSGYTYTQPTGCINQASGALWVTRTSGGQPSQCCSQADLGLNECIQTKNYASSCAVTACNTSRSRDYEPARIRAASTKERCTYRREDTRRYTSPITQQCQKTALVLLTDGDPSENDVDRGEVYSNGNARNPASIRTMIANADASLSVHDVQCDDYSPLFGGTSAFSRPYGNCAKELAEFMHTEDQNPSFAGSTIDTYAIGFGLTGPGAAATWQYLQEITSAGGGSALEANNLGTLVDAFQAIIDSVSSQSNSFTGYSTTLNTSTLTTSNKAYMPMFHPEDDRSWDGNLKGYFLLDGEVHDINGSPATEVDSSSGAVAFRAAAKSFWSDSIDGNNALQGGVVGELVPALRDLYVITDPGDVAGVALADGNHDLDTGNANLTADVLGMPSTATPAEVADMINWVRSARMGAPLHTEPLTIKYGGGVGEVLYFTTNQGFLHAIDVTGPTMVGDPAGGSEIFAFMPLEMIGTMAAQRADSVAGSYIYGLDGPLTLHLEDTNANGKVDAPGDRAFIYFGMRRGGSTYYAVDVTAPASPRLAWKIDAGQPGFERLGQSWSSMTPARISDGGTLRRVLIFGGGYDAAKQDVQNNARDPNGDSVGMGVYIVDAETGALLNSFGADDPVTPSVDFQVNVPGMKYSMPADIRVEDSNANGIADRLYMVDLGGQIWRADIAEGASISAASTVAPYLLADFSGAAVNDNRRFFYPPSVAIAARNGQPATVLAVGSGYRAHPLNTAIDDKFFVLFDTETVLGAPATTPAPLSLGSLYDATLNTLQTATGSTRTTELASLAASTGWFMDLPDDQKVLVEARIFDFKVFFNTFSSGVADPCDFTKGINHFYAVEMVDATGAIEADIDDDGVPDELVRGTVIEDSNAAIVSEPTIVTHAGNGPPSSAQPICSTVFAGSAPMMQICDAPIRVNWQTIR